MAVAVDVWRIYHVDPCQHTIPKPKPKFVAVVCIDARPMGFLINTGIDKWIQIDPVKLACQAPILVTEHPCLRYDSWVNCLDLFPFDERELRSKREFISPAGKASILKAVRNSKTLVLRLKKIILKG